MLTNIKNLFFLFALSFLSACSILPSTHLENKSHKGLKDIISPDKVIGISVDYLELKNNKTYSNLVKNEFSSITPENAMKFETLHPTDTISDFRQADYLVSFAKNNNLTLRGHTPIWHRQLPLWLKSKQRTKDQTRAIFDKHVVELISRYKNSIFTWDVVNEAINSDGSFRTSYWLNSLGKDYIKDAFILAHYANPKAKLFYNDYDISKPGPKFDAVYKLAKNLLKIKIPIHGIGFQMHLRPEFMPKESEIREVFNKISELGLEIHITELDIAIPLPASTEDIRNQNLAYEMVSRICKSTMNCSTLNLWSLSDKTSWIPSHFKGLGQACVYDENLNKKSAYDFLSSGLIKE